MSIDRKFKLWFSEIHNGYAEIDYGPFGFTVEQNDIVTSCNLETDVVTYASRWFVSSSLYGEVGKINAGYKTRSEAIDVAIGYINDHVIPTHLGYDYGHRTDMLQSPDYIIVSDSIEYAHKLMTLEPINVYDKGDNLIYTGLFCYEWSDNLCATYCRMRPLVVVKDESSSCGFNVVKILPEYKVSKKFWRYRG